MKKIFTIHDTLSDKISYYHLAAFLVTLPFDRFYSQLVLISFTLHTLIHLNKSSFKKIPFKEILVIQSVFWLSVVGMLYSKNHDHAGSMMSRQLAIFIFPILIYLNDIDIKRFLNRLLRIFALACTLIVLYLYVDAFRTISYNHLPFRSIASAAFLNHNFSLPIGLHATYLSLYIAISLIFLNTDLFRSNARLERLAMVLQMLLLFAGLVQLGSRTVFITTVLFTAFIFPIFNLNGKVRRNYLIISMLFLSLVGLAISQLPGLKARFLNNLATDLGIRHSLSVDDPRIERWRLAVKIIGRSPIIGHGTGEELDLLKESYFRNKLFNSYLFDLNAHNEFLSILIKNGILGLLIYLGTIAYGFLTAWRKRDIIFTGFLLLLFMLSFSENFLDVNKGIFFYAFFFSVFMKCNFINKDGGYLTPNKIELTRKSAG